MSVSLLPSGELPLFVYIVLYLKYKHKHILFPSVLAGIAGALPFVGSYWVTLPAVLELWLIEGRTLAALLLFILSLLPVFYVDTIINSEIEGYVTIVGFCVLASRILFEVFHVCVFVVVILI